eukprot:m.1011927 g.1011927  ORF g.1011927 m.1011927 type:complete len:137 (-) comp24064_c0_seq2:15-425(-)
MTAVAPVLPVVANMPFDGAGARTIVARQKTFGFDALEFIQFTLLEQGADGFVVVVRFEAIVVLNQFGQRLRFQYVGLYVREILAMSTKSCSGRSTTVSWSTFSRKTIIPRKTSLAGSTFSWNTCLICCNYSNRLFG